jgi:hypothetical protein
MRRLAMSLAAAAVAVTVVACSTITEELPNRPSTADIRVGTGAIPIVIVNVPIPSPQAPAPGPGPNEPPPPPRPVPTNNPNPNPNPGPGIPPNIPNNGSPVAKLGAKVYFVEVNGQAVPGTEGASQAPFNSRIHLDCTPKDASNAPTQARGTPVWTYSDPSLISVSGRSPYNPVLTPRGSGSLTFYAEVDGIRSNTVSLTIQ